MDVTPEQRCAIEQPGNLIVTAGAGSGKTYVLVERYLRLLLEHATDTDSYDAADLLAITFTDKAAREMRTRVRTAVEDRARVAPRSERPAWEERRAAVEAARIGTIHSFCATLLRAHPAETGLDPRFGVLDEVESGLLIAESVELALSEAIQRVPAERPDLMHLFAEFGLDEMRSLLVALLQGGCEVRVAIADLPDSVALLRTQWDKRLHTVQATTLAELLHSVNWGKACATICRLAAVADAQDRLGEKVLNIASWLAQTEATTQADLSESPSSSPRSIDFTPIQTIKLNVGSKKNWPSAEVLSEAKTALRLLRETYNAYAIVLEIQPDPAQEERAARVTLGLRALYQQALELYTQRKEQNDQLDYDDLERRAVLLLTRYPSVRTRWRSELRAVLVDEFQDTNDEQRAIIYALTGLDQPDQRDDSHPGLFVVGDAKQSIYRFRGADVSVFRTVGQDLLAAGGQAVNLDSSFRMHPPLLDWINQTVAPIMDYQPAPQPYEVPYDPLKARRHVPPHTGCVELHIVNGGERADETRTTEAHTLAARLKALAEGAAGPVVLDKKGHWRKPDYDDMALLFQASTVFEYYEQALREQNIPYLTTAGRGYYGRKEVQDLIHLLRVLNDPTDELSLVGVLRSPLFALEDATIVRLRFANAHSLWDALLNADAPPDAAEISDASTSSAALSFAQATLRELYARRGQLTVVELLRTALVETGYMATISSLPDGERRCVNVEKLVEAARRTGGGGLSAFSAYLESLLLAESREGEAPLETQGSVRLMTIHRSKGLEFPIVVLPDLGRRGRSHKDIWLARRAYGLALQLRNETSEWQKPVAYQLALAQEQRMERAERERLLYVALTRARDYLLLSGAAAKHTGEDWLSQLVQVLGQPWESGGPEGGRYGELQVYVY